MRALILLSGGIDSAVCAALYREHERAAIGFDYGQPHAVELESAARFAKAEGVDFEVLKIPHIGKINDVEFAGRNAVLLAHGVSIAASRGLDIVVIGNNASDHVRFPDCRPTFILPLRKAMQEAYGVSISAPLMHLSKREVVERAGCLGLDLADLWTCYNPQPGNVPCGVCASCAGRAEAGA